MPICKTPIALPENHYLLLVGQIAYMVSSLEWTILGDLERLGAHLPPDLTVETLAGKSTGQIEKKLEAAVDPTTEPDIKTYIKEGARVLDDAAERRNDLLHAWPATSSEGNQRLKRWKAEDHRGPYLAFVIETDWLHDTIDALSKLTSSLSGVRPLHPLPAEE